MGESSVKTPEGRGDKAMPRSGRVDVVDHEPQGARVPAVEGEGQARQAGMLDVVAVALERCGMLLDAALVRIEE